MDTITEIPTSEIFADEDFNCRGTILPTDVIDLASDMQSKGLLQPILVTKLSPDRANETGRKYLAIAGYRRLTAATKILRWEKIPAIIRSDLSEADIIAINLSENLMRQNLNIMQEARALNHFLNLGYTEEGIGDKIHQSRGWVQIRVMLLKMPKDVQDIASAGYINTTQIRELYKLRDSPKEQVEAAVRLKENVQKGALKKPTVNLRKTNMDARTKRTPAEINEMLDYIFEHVTASIATRSLAWANGACTTREYLTELNLFYAGRVTEDTPNGQKLPVTDFETYGNPKEIVG